MRAESFVRLSLLSAVAIAIGAVFAAPAHADDRYYVGPNLGTWDSATNWAATPDDPGGASVPGDHDSAYLTSPDSMTVTFNKEFPNTAWMDLLILKSFGSNTFTLNMDHFTTPGSPTPIGHNPVLRTIDVGIGMSGNGIFNQSAGTHNAEDNVYVGYGSGSSGEYNFSGGTFSGPFYLAIGQQNATGKVNQTGGSMLQSVILVGAYDGTAEFNLSGNSILQSIEQHIGENNGHGTFTQTGGSNTVTGLLSIGDAEAASEATYKLSAGTLSVAQVNNSRQFLQTAGTLAVSGTFNNSGTATFAGTQQWKASSSLNASGNSTTTFATNAGDASTFTLKLSASDSAKVHFQSSQNAQSISITGSAAIDLAAAGQAANVINVKQLTLQTITAKLDLNNGALIVDAALTTPASLRSNLQRGYHAGAWDGPGISSSAAANDPSHKTTLGYFNNSSGAYTNFAGQSVGTTSLLVRYTLYGDANLDGQVNFADLVTVAQNYGVTGTAQWNLGDFDYDGNVGFSDLVKVAQNYGASILPPAASPMFIDDWQRAQDTVPEPITLLLPLTMTLVAATRRRR